MSNLKGLTVVAVCFAVVCAVFALPAFAQDDDHAMAGQEMDHGAMDHGDVAQGEGEPQMSAEEMAMMQAWQKAMTPGPQHAALAGMVGDYDLTVSTWMEPGAPPMVSQATAHREMMLDGRVMHETVQGSMMGFPFVGHGATGYDNVTGRYWSAWTDNMSTGLIVSYGDWDDETGGLVMHSDYADAMTGAMKKARMVTQPGEGGSETFTWYDQTADGEVKTMQIVYTKK